MQQKIIEGELELELTDLFPNKTIGEIKLIATNSTRS